MDIGPDELQRRLPTLTTLWCCETVLAHKQLVRTLCTSDDTHVPSVTLMNKKGANNGCEVLIQDQQIFVVHISSNIGLGPSQYFMQ